MISCNYDICIDFVHDINTIVNLNATKHKITKEGNKFLYIGECGNFDFAFNLKEKLIKAQDELFCFSCEINGMVHYNKDYSCCGKCADCRKRNLELYGPEIVRAIMRTGWYCPMI